MTRSTLWRSLALACLILPSAGCHVLTEKAIQGPVTNTSEELGRRTETYAKASRERDATLIVIEAGERTIVDYEDVRTSVMDSEWEYEYFSLTDESLEELGFPGAVLVWPITWPLDILMPLISTIVFPFTSGVDTEPKVTRKRRSEAKDAPFERFELRDPGTGASVSFSRAQGKEGVLCEELALNGLYARQLILTGAGGKERTIDLPEATIAEVERTRSAIEVARPKRIEVPAGAKLHDVVRTAPEGAWLQLSEGDYSLPYSLSLGAKSITIAGKGPSRTRLHCSGGTGISVWGSRAVTLRGLAVQMVTRPGGISVGVRNTGTLAMIGCDLRGARGTKTDLTGPEHKPGDANFRGGFGFDGKGSGQTTLEGCRFSDNFSCCVLTVGTHRLSARGCVFLGGELETVSIRGSSQARIKACQTRGGQRGVAVMDQARAEVQECNLRGELAGAASKGAGVLKIEGSTCSGQVGIFIDSTSPENYASRNRCLDNPRHGIVVQGKGRATLADNSCNRNKDAGILVGEEADVDARGNTCDGNTSGINVTSKAKLRASRNHCDKNRTTGIIVGGSALVTLENNTCEGNPKQGISVQEQARAEVRNNALLKNKDCGVAFGQTSSGTVSGNSISDSVIGVYYGPKTRVSILSNSYSRLRLNTQKGNK